MIRMKIYEREWKYAKMRASISEKRLSMFDDTNENENMRKRRLDSKSLEVEVLYKKNAFQIEIKERI